MTPGRRWEYDEISRQRSATPEPVKSLDPDDLAILCDPFAHEQSVFAAAAFRVRTILDLPNLPDPIIKPNRPPEPSAPPRHSCTLPTVARRWHKRPWICEICGQGWWSPWRKDGMLWVKWPLEKPGV